MPQPRFMHTATLLDDGSVLIIGGIDEQQGLFNVLRYDPAQDLWEEVGTINKSHANHKAVLLPDGRVMVTGGLDSNAQAVISDVEISAPDYSTWNLAAHLPVSRYGHQMLIYQGNVVVVGGATEWDSSWSADTFLNDVLLYIPESDQWQQVDTLSQSVAFHTVTEVNGILVVAGGRNDSGYSTLFETINFGE
jgi:N-acetylneuraminic acid mutarotase